MKLSYIISASSLLVAAALLTAAPPIAQTPETTAPATAATPRPQQTAPGATPQLTAPGLFPCVPINQVGAPIASNGTTATPENSTNPRGGTAQTRQGEQDGIKGANGANLTTPTIPSPKTPTAPSTTARTTCPPGQVPNATIPPAIPVSPPPTPRACRHRRRRLHRRRQPCRFHLGRPHRPHPTVRVRSKTDGTGRCMCSARTSGGGMQRTIAACRSPAR